jgi:uncharacterized damage-inducible protein DinB
LNLRITQSWRFIMPVSNPLDVLLAHNHWATRSVLTACAALSPQQFHQRFEMGPGSLHDTLTHLLSSTRAWADMLAGREMRPNLEGSRTAPELLPLFDEVCADLGTIARAHPVEELVTRSRGGKSYTFPRGAVLTHVTTHAMHHRAQCLNMLRHVGVSPLPASSVLEWMIAGEPKG